MLSILFYGRKSMFFSFSWSQYSVGEVLLIRLYWLTVSGCVSPWHGQTDDKLLETLAKIIKIDSKIRLKQAIMCLEF
jgi:hypothetical protein